jgi:hypothetical protein
MVTPPFNLVPRSVVWPGETPTSSTGLVRPLVRRPAPYVTVHYTGAGEWDDFGDTIPEARAIQVYAQHARKPWEYNWIIDSEGNVVEYAGFHQAAHSGGENSISHGVLLLLGVGEPVTEAMKLAFRQLVWWLAQEGATDANTHVLPHREMPGAATACPNTLILGEWMELTDPWSPPPPPAPKENKMRFLIKDTRPPQAVWRSDGVIKTWVHNGHVAAELERDPSTVEVVTDDNVVIASFGPVVGPHPGAPYDAWGCF